MFLPCRLQNWFVGEQRDALDDQVGVDDQVVTLFDDDLSLVEPMVHPRIRCESRHSCILAYSFGVSSTQNSEPDNYENQTVCLDVEGDRKHFQSYHHPGDEPSRSVSVKTLNVVVHFNE